MFCATNEIGLTAPGEILDRTSELVEKNFQSKTGDLSDGMDICLISIDIKKQTDPVYRCQQSAMQPIGRYMEKRPLAHRIAWKKGDILFMFSDGYADQFGGEKGKKFKKSRFKEEMAKFDAPHAGAVKQQLEFLFENWVGVMNS